MTRRSLNVDALARPVRDLLKDMGHTVRVARLRRRKTMEDLGAAMMVSIPTVRKVEQGDPAVGLGTYLSALWALGLIDRAKPLGNPLIDESGQLLDLERLPQRVRKGRKHAGR